MKPIRIQRKRTKGWKMPPNTVYVGRPTQWGNPFYVGHHGTAQKCVDLYHKLMFPYRHHEPENGLERFYISTCNMESIIHELRGKNLACWCSLDQPCHADVLLEVANDGSLLQ